MIIALAGSGVSTKAHPLIEGLGHGSAFALTFLGTWIAAAWTRSFRWLALPLLAGLIAIGDRFVSIAPAHRISLPAPEFLIGFTVWSIAGVVLIACVSRKPFA